MQIKTVKRKETEEVLNKHLGMMQKLMTEMKMEMEMNVNPQGKTKKDSSKISMVAWNYYGSLF